MILADDDDKNILQYDRTTLLEFQSICTSKPDNLPNIDIVLATPHQPTKPLDPHQEYFTNFILTELYNY